MNRKEAENKIKNVIASAMNKKTFGKDCAKVLVSKFSMPPIMASNILNDYNVQINMINDKTLFQIMYAVKEAGVKRGNIENFNLNNYFTEEEIKAYSVSTFEEKKENIYPIVLPNCIEVNPGEQWVTTMTARQLFELNNKGMINYNKNTQRNLTQKKVGNNIEYIITLKQKSVNEISDLMSKGRFISNDITLNLNWEDPNLDFSYDSENSTIIVDNGKFDIIDGYHRFKALIKLANSDDSFDYNMIVNIMHFDEEKANRFIVQEDKRNKINSNYIKALDSQNPVYMIVKRLDDDSSSYLCGHIGREDETDKVTFNHLFNWIDMCFNVNERKEVISLTKLLKNIFNSVIESGVKIESMGFKEIGVIIMAASLYPEYEAIEKIKDKLKTVSKLDKENFARRIVNKRTCNIIKTFVEEAD